MHSDPTISYISSLFAHKSIDATSTIQCGIIFYLYHKKSASPTAIHNFLNAVDPDNPAFRSQSAVAHSLGHLVDRGFLSRACVKGDALYSNTAKAYRYYSLFLSKSHKIEKNITEIITAVSTLQPMHIDSSRDSC